MPAFDTHFNFAIGTVLSAPADASGQDFTLMPGDGQAFAANMPVTMCPRDVKPNGSNSEIGYITAVDGDALTILRAQERSIPMQVAANWQIFGSITAKTVTDIEAVVAGKADTSDLDALENVVAGKADIADLEALDQVVATKADRTELFSGDYIDLRGKPELGTAALTDATDYATEEQGAKADTAVQPEAISNVDNTSDLNKPVSNATQAELDNKADLVNGLILASQLPSYVDDVLAFSTLSDMPAVGESGKIYIVSDTNKQYRWSGTDYVEISKSLALGETSETAYRGDRGKEAYDHTLKTDNPHGTTKAQVGLADVDNTSDVMKPISTAVLTALNAKEPTIPTGNATQYVRADKTIQQLNKNAVGLANADNTSDINKPVSTAQAAADALRLLISDPRTPLRGVGFPNGVVSAPVGSTYTDTTALNGAIEWKKATGTGNTGWVVSIGDTGLRDITSSLISGWAPFFVTSITLQRIGPKTTLTIDGIKASARTADVVLALPLGFRPKGNYRFELESVVGTPTPMYRAYVDASGTVVVANSTTSFPDLFATIDLNASNAVAWPTSLPGTAVL